jgi:hypothetical protein
MNKNVKIGAAVVGLVVVAVLAFGVFGVQTLFFDNEVAEAGPIFDSQGASGIPSDDMTEDEVDEMNEVMVDEKIVAEVEADDPMPDMPEITRVVEGQFIDRIHAGEGTAVVLTDGRTQVQMATPACSTMTSSILAT